MPGLEIHPLSELRGEAAALLAERFARQRAAESLLPEIDDFEPHVPAGGLVATRGGAAVAYLADESGGDVLRPGFAGHAANEAEALRDLFAALTADTHATRFSVAVPASEHEAIDAWFRLAFGCQFIWAVRETDGESDVEVQLHNSLIRTGNPDDLHMVARFDQILWAHQARSPSFSGLDVPPLEEFEREWSDTWDDPETYPHFVAERDGRVVGHALLYRRPEGDLRVPHGNIDLAHAATLDDVRGTGVGLALTAHVLRWARHQGFRSMTTDWRSVNLLSSRFWQRRGFRPQYLRLYRALP
ncbi:MAG TPA: GNAT family N-acetyltransferase [Gaiellaceae bacterium]|nr:GNAT family N-acetyltransferase [Gaiellaceae bacterium]